MNEYLSANESQQSLVVNKIQGDVSVQLANGEEIPLVPGQPIPADAVLLIAQGASVEVKSADGQISTLTGPALQPVNAILPSSASGSLAQQSAESIEDGSDLSDLLAEQSDDLDDIEAIQQALLDGVDPTANLPAAAAGANAGGGLNAPANVERTGQEQDVNSGLDTSVEQTTAIQPLSFNNGLIVEDQTSNPTISISSTEIIYLNQDGVGGDDSATLAIAGSVTDIAPGSTISLVITDGLGGTVEAQASVADDGSYLLEVGDIGSLAEGELTATVSGQGPDGTTVTAVTNPNYDLLPTVSIEPVAGNDTTPTLSGTSANINGDLTLDINGQSFTVTPNADGSWEFTVPADAELVDGSYTATISGDDAEGNTATASTDFALIPTIDAPVVTITEDFNDDGEIDSSELSGTVGVSVALPGNALAGDVLNVTDQDPIVLTQAQIDAGIIEFEFPVPADGETINVSASVTVTERSANDSAEGSDSAVIGDTTAPTLSITLAEGITEDDVINASEANQDIAVTGSVIGDFVEGDTVTLTVNAQTYTGTVDGDGNFSIDVAGADLAADT
ncbi:retention module-containing protein, partial [Neiella marina]